MTVYVTEFGGPASDRPTYMGVAYGQPIKSGQIQSSGTIYTLSSGTEFIMISWDVGCWLLVGSSASTSVVGSTVASTSNGLRLPGSTIGIPPGNPIPWYVQPGWKLSWAST
jgi:hypothetical protein